MTTENYFVVKHVETYISKMTSVVVLCVSTVFFVPVDKGKIYKNMNSISAFGFRAVQKNSIDLLGAIKRGCK